MKNNYLKFIFILCSFCFISHLFSNNIYPKFNYFTADSAKIVLEGFDDYSHLIFKYNEIILLDSLYDLRENNIVDFSIDSLQYGNNEISYIFSSQKDTISGTFNIKKFKPKANQVQIDLQTGSFFYDKLYQYPIGFYCYAPVDKTLPEEEVVNGFNLICPYHKIEKKTLKERKEFMDRCAELGIKVNYNILNIAGGGGVNSKYFKSYSEEEKLEFIRKEIHRFKDHPALLSWYISDEPDGSNTTSEWLEKVYNFIKELDPYHPVAIVFMRPKNSYKYENSMDIVMTDPYPIPVYSVLRAENYTKILVDKFKHKKSVMIVPQAFGGNEWWKREPTPQELRVMTWLSVINGANGIQYFIRDPLNSFPKSQVAWNEAGKCAMEIQEIIPFLTSTEKGPTIESKDQNLRIASYKKAKKHLIIVINTKNKPNEFSIKLPESKLGSAKVLNENRSIQIIDSSLNDIIPAFGVNLYILDENKANVKSNNLVADGGFENSVVPGVPNHCYIYIGSERGATYFVDSRTSFSGEHSLRLHTPKRNRGATIKYFPVKTQKSQKYKLSLMAKGNQLPIKPKKSFWQRLFRKKDPPFYLRIKFGYIKEEFFEITPNWDEYYIEFSTPEKSLSKSQSIIRIELIGAGTAWIDDLTLTKIE